jgi:hypothetical protein
MSSKVFVRVADCVDLIILGTIMCYHSDNVNGAYPMMENTSTLYSAVKQRQNGFPGLPMHR